MTNTELWTYRRYLLALQNRLQTNTSGLADEALGKPGDEASVYLSHAPIHMADQGSDRFEQQFTLIPLEKEEQTVTEIAAALERLEQGTFGCCEKCQRKIPQARLYALPFTRYCFECERETLGRGTTQAVTTRR